jgi:hypothetical protein
MAEGTQGRVLVAALVVLLFLGTLVGEGADLMCGNPDGIRPLFPPCQGAFDDISQGLFKDTGQSFDACTILLIGQSGGDDFDTVAVGWEILEYLDLREECRCGYAARWPDYVRWESGNPCLGNT